MCRVEIDEAAKPEIVALPDGLKSRLARYILRIQDVGLEGLDAGVARHVEGKLWDLRLKAPVGIARTLYFTLHPKRVLIVSAFVKKTQKLPLREKEKAESRMKAIVDKEAAKVRESKS